LFDQEAVDVLRFFTNLKCRLMPYLFGAALQAHHGGTPVMRAMILEFPDDPACDTLDRQYMLGDGLLVAPVLRSDGAVDYYLPAGRWTHFLSGKVVEGGRWLREQHDFLSLPLLVRPNMMIAVGSSDQRPDYEYTQGVTLHLFELEEGAQAIAEVPTPLGSPGLTVTARRSGACIQVEAQGSGDWAVLLRGIASISAVDGGTAVNDTQGTRILPQSHQISIWL
jgi:alpha-D-xyloside xylohydrolase